VQLSGVMAKARPGVVFHMAAHHYIPFCNEHPRQTLRVNVEGTQLVLSEAARQGARVAVVASSGVIYPNLDGPLSEDLEAVPADVYGLSKHMTEQVTRFIANTTEMSCVAARLFNTYGPYETNPHLIPHIVHSLQRGPSVKLGNIHTKRDYIYVEDVAEMLYNFAQTCKEDYTLVNVGTGIDYSAEQIVQTIAQLLGYEIKIRIDPTRVRPIDKLYQRADTRRLETLTSSRARNSLADGLRHLLVHEQFAIAHEKAG
jgi:UDP-glucose 4-epimerase